MSERRHTDKPDLNPWAVRGLDPSHPAMVENRTLFPTTVVDVTQDMQEQLLVSGRNSRKLGATVEKGRFKGYAIYGLSLEERATCPQACAVRDVCYGNGMQLARRHRIGDPEVFYDKLGFEICDLLDAYPDGLLIRLHVLGDFPDVEYVGFWADVLSEHEKVAVYGYTARLTTAWGGDEIGDAIQAVKDQYPDRFRIRWSSPVSRPDGAMVIGHIPSTPRTDEGIICPAQTDATACCATCALCWDAPKEPIVFIKHGPKSNGAAAASAMADAGDFGEKVDAALDAVRHSPVGLRRVKAMELRPEPKPLARVAPTPEPRLVSPEDLLVEPAYQRDLSSASVSLIRKIVNGWDWSKYKPPICAEAQSGLCVIDGQHTAIAAATRGIAKIPVLVVSASAMETRAEAFVSHNRDRLNMSPFQIIHAEAAAGDLTAIGILALAEKTGAIIPRSAPLKGRTKPGTILPINKVRAAYRGSGPVVVERVFRIAVGAKATPLGSTAWQALMMLLTAPVFADAARYPDSRLANALASFENFDRAAREAEGQTGQPLIRGAAQLLADACSLEAAA